MNRRRLIFGAAALTAAGAAIAQTRRQRVLAGVNLAGLEFTPRAVPGQLNRHYAAPSRAAVRYYAREGFDFIRLPFRWERAQPTLGGPLNSEYVGHIDDVVAAAREVGMTVMISAHQYGRRRENRQGHIIGESAVVRSEHFADFWRRMAQRFGQARNVMFGLTNEPHDQDMRVLVDTQNMAIAAIRGAGADQLVLASGNAWSGAHSWVRSGNAAAMLDIVDPGDNLAFDVHQYLDSDSSGRSGACIPGAGARRLRPFTAWAQTHGKRGLLGEIGVGRNEACRGELVSALRHTQANADVWLGWAYWAGGPWWGEDYEFSIEPQALDEGPPRPQLEYLRPFLR